MVGVVFVVCALDVVSVFCWVDVAIVVVEWVCSVECVAVDFVLLGFFVCFIGVFDCPTFIIF